MQSGSTIVRTTWLSMLSMEEESHLRPFSATETPLLESLPRLALLLAALRFSGWGSSSTEAATLRCWRRRVADWRGGDGRGRLGRLGAAAPGVELRHAQVELVHVFEERRLRGRAIARGAWRAVRRAQVHARLLREHGAVVLEHALGDVRHRHGVQHSGGRAPSCRLRLCHAPGQLVGDGRAERLLRTRRAQAAVAVAEGRQVARSCKSDWER
eukprot:1386910-Pleurochrysis_carterae.AAC.1